MTRQKEGPAGVNDAGKAVEGSRGGAEQALTASQSSSDDVIEAVVHRLSAVCRQATFEVTLAVGSTIIEYLYGGDLSSWRSRDPRKIVSLRKLARHPHLPMSPSALYRSVAIYELCERLHLKCSQHVSTGHLRLVLPLRGDDQVRLLQMTEANRWTVRRLDQEIRQLVERKVSRGGPRRRSRLSRAALRVGESLDTLERCMDPTVHDPDPSPASVREAIACLRRAAEVCAMVERRLSDRSPR